MAKEAFYIVWNPDSSMPPRCVHPDFETASKEAERLARKAPGHNFYVMQSHRRIRTTEPLEIEDFDTSIDIPF